MYYSTFCSTDINSEETVTKFEKATYLFTFFFKGDREGDKGECSAF